MLLEVMGEEFSDQGLLLCGCSLALLSTAIRLTKWYDCFQLKVLTTDAYEVEYQTNQPGASAILNSYATATWHVRLSKRRPVDLALCST
jgi:hypothetical protein